MSQQNHINEVVKRALAEDLGAGDISSQLIAADQLLQTQLLVREDAVLCGMDWCNASFHQCNSAIQLEWRVKDGDFISADTVLCSISGNARAILTAERTALNFLQTLSGTATITNHYASMIRHTRCKLLDTRKTIPQLRLAQKYAVTCGGGFNHRIGLFDAYLIKENHLSACGDIATAVHCARQLNSDLLLEVEVESLPALSQAIDAGADRVLLDNFTLAEIRQAVTLNQNRIQLEASGNITDQNLVAVAEAGVDFISIGALTKHLRAIDFSLRFIES